MIGYDDKSKNGKALRQNFLNSPKEDVKRQVFSLGKDDSDMAFMTKKSGTKNLSD